MRILHATDCYLPMMGGIEMQVSGLAVHQAGHHDVMVFNTTAPHPRASGVFTETDRGVQVRRAAARMPGGMPVHPLAPQHFARALADFSPDVVHVHMGGTAPSVQLSLRLAAAAAPTVLTIHSVWTPAVSHAYRLLSAATRFPSWGVKLATVSRLCARPVAAATGTEVMVVGNGVDIDRWRLGPLPHDGVHVVSATRFAPRKRIGALLRTLAAARRELGAAAPLRATIAGEGPLLERARAWVRAHGLDSWVHLPGRLDAAGLQDLYRTADVYLAPVVLEAFSIAVLEAQAAGLAVVVRSQSGAAERITPGVHGLVADDDAALAAHLVRLVRAPALLESIRSHNRAVPPPYDWQTVAARTMEVYAAAGAR